MIYVSTACIRERKISEVLQKYSEAGIQNIELSGGTSYYSEIERDLKKYGEQYKIKYACHSYFPPHENDFVVNLAACNDEIYERSMEHYRKCIELLERIKCNVLSIHAGFYVEVTPKTIGRILTSDIIYDQEQAVNRFCSAYREIDKRCKDSGIQLYLENNVLSLDNFKHFGNRNLLMLTDFESFKELRGKLNFNLLLDLGHLYVSANTLKKDYMTETMKYAPYVRWLHMSENDGVTDQHRPLMEMGEILKVYQKYFDSNIPITLETNGSMKEIMNSISLLGGKVHE